MTPRWVAQYIGLEFKDHGRGPQFDCWGLVRHVLAREFAIAAPDLGDFYMTDRDGVGIPQAVSAGREGWDRVEEGQEGDVIVISIRGVPMHCGIVVEPGYMLHILPGSGSVLEPYTRPQWCRRIEGIYRHRCS